MDALHREFAFICRFCLRHKMEATNDQPLCLQSLYDCPPAEDTLTISEIFRATTPWILISATDELPQVLCNDCLKSLIEVHNFQKMCLESEQKLLSLLEGNPSQIEEFLQQKNVCTAVSPAYAGIIIKNEFMDFEENKFKLEFDNHLTKSTDETFQTVKNEPITDIDDNFESGVQNIHFAYVASDAADDDFSEATSEPTEKGMLETKTKASAIKEKHISCNECGKIYSNTFTLNRHKRTLHSVRHLKCPCCKEEYKSSSDLAEHFLLYHGDVTKYTCDICGAIFLNYTLFTRHLDQFHPKKTNKHKRDDTRNENLQEISDITNPNEITILSARRDDADADISTNKTGKATRVYKCNICTKEYIQNGHFLRHMDTHRNTSQNISISSAKDNADNEDMSKINGKNKSKCKGWRERLKKDETKLQNYNLKNKERMRKAREKLRTMAEGNEEIIEKRRKYDRIRQQKRRQKLLENEMKRQRQNAPYECKQTFAKAENSGESDANGYAQCSS